MKMLIQLFVHDLLTTTSKENTVCKIFASTFEAKRMPKWRKESFKSPKEIFKKYFITCAVIWVINSYTDTQDFFKDGWFSWQQFYDRVSMNYTLETKKYVFKTL